LEKWLAVVTAGASTSVAIVGTATNVEAVAALKACDYDDV
jgi:DNA primase